MVGIWGTGSIHNVDVDVQAAEKKIEKYWADKGEKDEGGAVDLRGAGMGSEENGKEKLI